MKHQIIRVEHTDGAGMFVSYYHDLINYRTYKVSEICWPIAERHNSFNNPKEDGLIIEDDDFCAYKSIEYIQEWIKPEEFQVLFDNDYSVYLIEVSDCQIGRDNVLFKKKDIISKTDISSLFKTKTN